MSGCVNSSDGHGAAPEKEKSVNFQASLLRAGHPRVTACEKAFGCQKQETTTETKIAKELKGKIPEE